MTTYRNAGPCVTVLPSEDLKGILIKVVFLGPALTHWGQQDPVPLSGGTHELTLELVNMTDYDIEQLDIDSFKVTAPGGLEQTFGLRHRVYGLGRGQRTRLVPFRVSLPVPGIYYMECRLVKVEGIPQGSKQLQTLQYVETVGRLGRGWPKDRGGQQDDTLVWRYPFTVADRVAHQQTRLAWWAVVIGVASALAAAVQLATLFRNCA